MRAHGYRPGREDSRRYMSRRREDIGETATWSEMFPVADHRCKSRRDGRTDGRWPCMLLEELGFVFAPIEA